MYVCDIAYHINIDQYFLLIIKICLKSTLIISILKDQVQDFDEVSYSSFPSREVCLRFFQLIRNMMNLNTPTFNKEEILIQGLVNPKIVVCN